MTESELNKLIEKEITNMKRFIAICFILLVFLIASAFMSTLSHAAAGGGQVKSKSPVFTEECVMQAPGIDLDTCVLQPAPPQSGIAVYFCNTDTVITCIIE